MLVHEVLESGERLLLRGIDASHSGNGFVAGHAGRRAKDEGHLIHKVHGNLFCLGV
jgi:hypothetical protein